MTTLASKSIFLAVISALTAICSAGTAMAGGNYSVDLNKTEIVRLPENAGAVIIGNPKIADVTVHSANTLFVMGRGYGETNLIVLSAAGQTIMDANIQVINRVSSQGVRLYNGRNRESYSCVPYCMPSPILGDDPKFIKSNSGKAQSTANTVSTASPTPIFNDNRSPFSTRPRPNNNMEPPSTEF